MILVKSITFNTVYDLSSALYDLPIIVGGRNFHDLFTSNI